MPIRLEAPVTVKGTVKAKQATEQGEAVILDNKTKIPTAFIPTEITAKANKYVDAEVNIVALYQSYSDSASLRNEIQTLWDGGDTNCLDDQFLVLCDETKNDHITLYTFKGTSGWIDKQITIDRPNTVTAGSETQIIYSQTGEIKSGMSFRYGTSVPSDSEGKEGDIYFRYVINE